MISRKNRDRKGGHKSGAQLTVNRFIDGAVYYSPVERKLIKQISKKKMRRQHATTLLTVERALANDWTWQDQEREIELADMWYDDEPMYDPYWEYDSENKPTWYDADLEHDQYPSWDEFMCYDSYGRMG